MSSPPPNPIPSNSYYGLDGAKKELDKITENAIQQLNDYGEKSEFLKQLASYIKNRNK